MKLQQQQPTEMVPMKPIGLREMIESAEIAAMKREKDETLPDCYHSDRFGYELPRPKPTTSTEVKRRLFMTKPAGGLFAHNPWKNWDWDWEFMLDGNQARDNGIAGRVHGCLVPKFGPDEYVQADFYDAEKPGQHQ